jgi:NADPH-dependent FMN reductase
LDNGIAIESKVQWELGGQSLYFRDPNGNSLELAMPVCFCPLLEKANMAQDEKVRDQVRIVAICGSLRPGSYTRMALQTALRGARETGAEATLIDLREYQLIFCDGKENESGYPNDVFQLRGERRLEERSRPDGF